MDTNMNRSGCWRAAVRTSVAAPLFMMWLLNACALSGQTVQPDVDRIMAENSQMKRRLPLIERQNDVLTQENLHYKGKLKQSAEAVEKLRSDLTALLAKFDNQVALSAAQLQQWQEKYSALEGASSQKIAELTGLNAELAAKRTQEIQELNARIDQQNSAFGQERQEMERRAAQKEQELSGTIARLEQTMGAREAEITSLKSAQDELTEKVGSLSSRLTEIQLQRDQIEKELQSARAANAELLQRLQAPGRGTLKSQLR